MLRRFSVLPRNLNTKAWTPSLDEKPRATGILSNKEVQTLFQEMVKLPSQRTISGCREMKDVRSMMEIYRISRDNPERVDKVAASDVVNAILETTRQRHRVFRKMFLNERNPIIETQNQVLLEFLDEILVDLTNGKSYISAYAISFLLTAFSGMGRSSDIINVWTKLMQVGANSPEFAKHLRRPQVISAALTQADPKSLSLEFVETTYEQGVRDNGPSIYLDEALIQAYLNFSTPDKVTEKYAEIFQTYPIQAHERTLTRIHNRILTDVQDIRVGEAFFEMGLKPSQVTKLHPGAITQFLRRKYSVDHDFEQFVSKYMQSVNYYHQHHAALAPSEFGGLTNALWYVFGLEFPQDIQSGRTTAQNLLQSFTELYPKDWTFFNTCLTTISRNWLDSDFPQVLIAQALEKMDFDHVTCRVILNSKPDIETIQKIWAYRTTLPERLSTGDLTALVKACNTQDKARAVVPILASVVSQQQLDSATVRNSISESPLLSLVVTESNNDVLTKL